MGDDALVLAAEQALALRRRHRWTVEIMPAVLATIALLAWMFWGGPLLFRTIRTATGIDVLERIVALQMPWPAIVGLMITFIMPVSAATILSVLLSKRRAEALIARYRRGSLCAFCEYDLSGAEEDDGRRQCPECGKLTMPLIAAWHWRHGIVAGN